MILYQRLFDQLSMSVLPDLNLSVDQWADKFMVIPKASGSNEYGRYRTQRTPHAREIMRALSDDHPCKRVVCMVSSQMFKTQIALNWIGASVHQSPANFLLLMPTGKLQKRIAARVDKTVAEVDVLRERFAKPNSRSAINNLDTKEFVGGSLFIATAGSAANLSEVPARRVAFDEIDRADVDVDGEGDPVKLAESRQTTFAHNKKSYYYSSPTIDGESRIHGLFTEGTQRHALAECIHCGHAQDLVFEKLIVSEDQKTAMYPCAECGGLHYEQDKPAMFKNGLWSEQICGDGETESFTAHSMFLPYGWMSWLDLWREHEAAKKLLDTGNDSMMVVFYNTRLARTWKRNVQVVDYQSLIDRAEHYPLRIAPEGVLLITAGVDTQDNRLAVQIVGWGRNLTGWVLDYIELPGDPANDQVWDDLTELINLGIQHESGLVMQIRATAIDTGGHRGEAVKSYVRHGFIPTPIAIKGSSRYDAEPISKGAMIDVKWNGRVYEKGVRVHQVGTVEIKHSLFSKMKNDGDKDPSERKLRFTRDLSSEYFSGLISETYNRYKKRYEKKHDGVRNEPLDTLTYAYAALHHHSIRAHRFSERDWVALESRILNQEIIKKREPNEVEKTQIKKISNMSSRGKNLLGSLRDRLKNRER